MTASSLKKKAVFLKQPRDELIMNIIFFLMCFSAVFVSALITAGSGTQKSTLHLFGSSFRLNGICFFKEITGYNCPVCGMTRCFAFMSHGRFNEAVKIAPAGVPLYILCVFESIYRALRIIFGKFIYKKAIRIAETVLIIIAAASIVFFFIAQFFISSLII